MCGICGVYSPTFSGPELTVFKNLLQINVLRGEDSTGVVKLQSNNEGDYESALVRRTLKPSPAYVWSGAGRKFLVAKDSLGYIGHTRAATKGSVTLDNAHPFVFDKITGVHNGTIPGIFRNSADFETDSEALYKGLDEEGTSFLTQFETQPSAYALVWVDKENNTLNFIRNDKRPLHFTFVYGGQTLLWSSQEEHLRLAVKKSKLTPKGWEKGKPTQDYFTISPGHLLSIPLGANPKLHGEITDLGLKKYTPPVSVWQGWPTYTPPASKIYDSGQNDRVFHKRADGRYRTDAEERVFQNKDYEGFANDHEELSELPWLEDKGSPPFQAEALLSAGCYCCSEVVEKEELDTVFWQGESYACDPCYHDSPDDWVRKTHLGIWDIAVN